MNEINEDLVSKLKEIKNKLDDMYKIEEEECQFIEEYISKVFDVKWEVEKLIDKLIKEIE